LSNKEWGGIREGSGRPPLESRDRKIGRHIYLTWSMVEDINRYGEGSNFSEKVRSLLSHSLEHHKNNLDSNSRIPLTVVELFAGVGGFRRGLELSGADWSFVWANQWEPGKKAQYAFDCYVSHFGKGENHVCKDINRVDKSGIPEHSLLVGGFPCQDYSVARTGAEGIHGKKGVLWWDIYDVLVAKNPNFVLLENVDRLLKSPAKQRGRDFGVMLSCFDSLNYSVEWRIINAADYGFPQRRRRAFIFAYKNDTSYADSLRDYSPEDLLHRSGFFQAQFPIKEVIITSAATSLEFIDLVDVSENFRFEFANAGLMHDRRIYTERTTPDYHGEVQVLGSVLESSVDKKYYINGSLRDWEFLKGSKHIDRTSRTGHQYTFSEGAIPFPDPVDRPARTMLTSESTKNRSTHIIQDPETGRLRLLTPVEAERLNGFPDNWTDTGMPERQRYFCMGNALVVGLIQKMGTEIARIIRGE